VFTQKKAPDSLIHPIEKVLKLILTGKTSSLDPYGILDKPMKHHVSMPSVLLLLRFKDYNHGEDSYSGLLGYDIVQSGR
jgi:hypothetical protein